MPWSAAGPTLPCSALRASDDAAQAEEGTFIAAGVCEELDDMKALYMGLPDFLTQAGPASAERSRGRALYLYLYLELPGRVPPARGGGGRGHAATCCPQPAGERGANP